MFLTPDQEQVRCQFDKGIVVAPAGTGKTVVLRAIADQIIKDRREKGYEDPVVWVSSHPHDVRMRKHFQGTLNIILSFQSFSFS